MSCARVLLEVTRLIILFFFPFKHEDGPAERQFYMKLKQEEFMQEAVNSRFIVQISVAVVEFLKLVCRLVYWSPKVWEPLGTKPMGPSSFLTPVVSPHVDH